MIEVKKKQETYLKENFNDVVIKINIFFEKQQGFILKDLLDKENYNHYYIHVTKGILICLINLGYIEIFSIYGNKNFTYRCLKKVEIKYTD